MTHTGIAAPREPNRPAERRVFKVRGMDCAEEVAVLKDVVGPVVGGADRLSFDILADPTFAPSVGNHPARNLDVARCQGGLRNDRHFGDSVVAERNLTNATVDAARSPGAREPFWRRARRRTMSLSHVAYCH